MNTLSSSANAVQRNASDSQLPEPQRELLNRLLEQMLSLGVGVPALKFRAENYSAVATLDQLETSGLLKRDNDTYIVRSGALSFLDSEPARRLLSDIERVYAVLRTQYRQAQQAQVPISTSLKMCGARCHRAGAPQSDWSSRASSFSSAGRSQTEKAAFELEVDVIVGAIVISTRSVV